MTNLRPCLKHDLANCFECCYCEHLQDALYGATFAHLPACPNAEAPKVEIVDLMGALKRSLDQHPNARPAPEPKQGSEVDMRDEYATGDGRVWVLKTAYLALRAEVEELKADKERRKGSAVDRLHNLCDGFDEMDKEQQAKIDALRAQLAEKEQMVAWKQMLLDEVGKNFAQAQDELAKLQRLYSERCNEADNAYVAPRGEPR